MKLHVKSSFNLKNTTFQGYKERWKLQKLSWFHMQKLVVAWKLCAVCIVLKRLAYPVRYCDMVYLFGRSVPELWKINLNMINYIYDNHSFRSNHFVYLFYFQIYVCCIIILKLINPFKLVTKLLMIMLNYLLSFIEGRMTKYFKFVDFKQQLKLRLSPVGKLYIVCAILQNSLACL